MHKYHKEIKALLLKKAENKENKTTGAWGNNYTGSNRKILHLKNAVKQQVIKNWARMHKNLSYDDLTALIDSIIDFGEYIEEYKTIGDLLLVYKTHRQNLDLTKIYNWVSNLQGWEEIDSLCQSSFDVKDLETRWQEWKNLLRDLNKSKNISCRRASLVLLIKTVRKTQNLDIIKTAFDNIDNLKHEKDILITKAISWLLRETSRAHSKLMREYLNSNKESLPKIAVREVTRKLNTGRK